MSEKVQKIISLILGVLAMSLMIGYLAFAAWTGPSANPPGENVPAPINVGDKEQTKSGRLGIGVSDADDSFQLTVGGKGIKITNTGSGYTFYAEDESDDATPFVIDYAGKVGIGTKYPSSHVGLDIRNSESLGNRGQIIVDTYLLRDSSTYSYVPSNSAAHIGMFGGNLYITNENWSGISGKGIIFSTKQWEDQMGIIYGGNVEIYSGDLDVQNGAIKAKGYIRSDTGFCIGSNCITSWPSGGANYWVLSGSNLYPSSTAWNVGIGTTAPEKKLHVKATGDWVALFGNDGGNAPRAGIWAGGSGTAADPYRAIFGTPNSNTQVRLNVGGNDYLTVATAGNVGIGTTNPSRYVGLDIRNSESLGNRGQIIVDTYLLRNTPNLAYVPSDAAAHIDVFNENLYIVLHNWTGTSGRGVYLSTKQGENKMGLIHGGNVEIYSGDLDVQNGAIKAKGYIRSDTGFCIGSNCITSWPSGGANYWVLSGSNLYPSSTAWNVGIGTTAPEKKLHVKATGDWVALFGNDGNSAPQAGIWAGGSGTNADPYRAVFGIRHSTGGVDQVRLNIGGTDYLTINDNGNIGIGTTNPQQKLHVVGYGAIDSWDSQLYTGYWTGNAHPYLRRSIGGANGWDQDTNGNGQKLYINGFGDWPHGVSIGSFEGGFTSDLVVNGNVGIGTTNPGTNKLKVAGDTEITDNLSVGGSISGFSITDTYDSGYLKMDVRGTNYYPYNNNYAEWTPPASWVGKLAVFTTETALCLSGCTWNGDTWQPTDIESYYEGCTKENTPIKDWISGGGSASMYVVHSFTCPVVSGKKFGLWITNIDPANQSYYYRMTAKLIE